MRHHGRRGAHTHVLARAHDIEGGIVYADFSHTIEVLGDGGKQLYRDLIDVADKISFLPATISDQLRVVEPGLCIREHETNTNDIRSQDEPLWEMRQLQRINQLSPRCVWMAEGEAEWNSAVHSALFCLALEEHAIAPGPVVVDMKYMWAFLLCAFVISRIMSTNPSRIDLQS